VELRNQFHMLLDRPIPANLVFDHSNVGALSTYLSSMLPGLQETMSGEK
jgi:hypothetical protein